MFIIPIDQKNNPRKCVQEYTKIKRLLTKKYGSPSSNESGYKKNMPKAYLKSYQRKIDGKELAFNDKNFTYLNTWKKEKFIVKLKAYKAYKIFVISLAYSAPPKKASPVIKVATTEKKVDPLTEL
jgi:hypothetical protein